jgi:hypothetical protein
VSEGAIGTGILAGLNNNTPDATLKVSAEVEFHLDRDFLPTEVGISPYKLMLCCNTPG